VTQSAPRRVRLLGGLLLLVPVFGACSDPTAGEGEGEGEGEIEGLACPVPASEVTTVKDGDTLAVVRPCTGPGDCLDGEECVDGGCATDFAVRLMAINAGEIAHSRAELPECMAEDARLALERLTKGQQVRLVYEPLAGCTEVYGRGLAYVWVGDILVQERLLEQGLACLYWYDNEREQEQTLYYARLATAQERAQKLGLGIWSSAGACRGLLFPERCLD
jgi:micrococcal nuclease